jgi:hypothetical protein
LSQATAFVVVEGGDGSEESEALTGLGFSVMNPADFRNNCRDTRHAVLGLMTCDVLVIPREWGYSNDARMMAAIAGYVGIPVVVYPDLEALEPADFPKMDNG